MALPISRSSSRLQAIHRHHSYNRRWKREVGMIRYALPPLVDLLSLKFQGKSLSPFDTHSCFMTISIIGLLLFFFFLHSTTTNSHQNNFKMILTRIIPVKAIRSMLGHARGFLGSLIIAMLASLCLPRSLFWVAYLIFALASLDQILQLLKCSRNMILQTTLGFIDQLKTRHIHNDSEPLAPNTASYV